MRSSIVVLILLSGCSSGATSDPCDDVRARFRATWAARTDACTPAADCGCANPVIAELRCGAVTDAPTATALAAIESDFHAHACDWPHQCPATVCAPRCEAGRCVP